MRLVNKPWGNYLVLKEEDSFKVKLLTIFPSKRFSLQKHKFRSEFWFVVHGEGKAEVGNREIILVNDTTVNVPKNSLHRITNTGHFNLSVLEIQYGLKLIESDIIRVEDDYGRK